MISLIEQLFFLIVETDQNDVPKSGWTKVPKQPDAQSTW